MVEPICRDVSPCETDVCVLSAGMEDLGKTSATMHEKQFVAICIENPVNG